MSVPVHIGIQINFSCSKVGIFSIRNSSCKIIRNYCYILVISKKKGNPALCKIALSFLGPFVLLRGNSASANIFAPFNGLECKVIVSKFFQVFNFVIVLVEMSFFLFHQSFKQFFRN